MARGEKIDVVAPGELVCSTGEFGDLLIESGTSLAAPQVAAVASKIMEENPEASNEEVKNAIINGANYNLCEEDEYGLLDEEYVLKNYDELKDCDIQNKSKSNNADIEIVGDSGCVKGSWILNDHEELIGSEHSNVKKGARYPDKDGSVFENIKPNPWWHGSYRNDNNYIASYIFATRMAEKMGQEKSPTTASVPSGLTDKAKNDMLADMGWLTKKENGKDQLDKLGMTTKGKKRAFVWGMAIHTGSDVFSHSSYVYLKDEGKWAHLAHGDAYIENGVTKCDNKYADKKSYLDRYTAAREVVKLMISKYDANNGGGSYIQFSGISKSKKNYRLLDFLKYIKQTPNASNAKTPYSDYTISDRGIILSHWEG